MRYLAIGDIHGCSQALERLLAIVRPQPEDIIITLGDYLNKGPDSQGVIEKLIQLAQTHRLIPLKGNHEVQLLQARSHHFNYSNELEYLGIETLISYSLPARELSLANIPERHWEFLEHICLDSWESEHHIFVHANLAPQLPLNKQSDWHLFWQKLNQPMPHYSGKTMICGHTSQKNGQPLNFGHAICIDTWACGGGWLTCLDVYGGHIWQTNQQGQVKHSRIEQFFRPQSLITI
ncbi:MAG: metallophosphoesterase family protein [Calothrix sp. MO_192.B10]|nr:metallophosphoesterase family protein [Calothrix sp. MO_192.B10]